MYLCMCVCVCMCVCMCVCVYVCMYLCVYICTWVCMCLLIKTAKLKRRGQPQSDKAAFSHLLSNLRAK